LKSAKSLYSNIEKTPLGHVIRRAYFSCAEINDYFSTRGNFQRKIVVLTFDDTPSKESMKLPLFLAKKKIPAAFFIPASSNYIFLSQIAKMGHELGGHGFEHKSQEKQGSYEITAKKSHEILKKYDKNVASWRFPFLSYDEKCVKNVRLAGFCIDSSAGSFYPQKKLERLGELEQVRFLRLPTRYWMDLGGEPQKTYEYILRKIRRSGGVFVLPFHIHEQASHFKEFQAFIEKLQSENVEFMQLRDAAKVLGAKYGSQ
jgi:peptidoglycan/xylan/chitin deacetylase (PgdA/CDA1 family)